MPRRKYYNTPYKNEKDKLKYIEQYIINYREKMKTHKTESSEFYINQIETALNKYKRDGKRSYIICSVF